MGLSNTHMSPRARIVERRTYLRPLNEDGTVFETPDDMKDRVISHQRWLWENQIGRKLNLVEEAELTELRDLMDRSLVTMSGRVKWMGGTDLVKERSSAAFNCLGVETPFITDQGVRSFADFKDGDTVNVWTHKGRWRKATVRSYGEQALHTITFGRTKTEIAVRATANHRWLLDNGKGETTALAVRDRIARPVSDFAAWDFDAADVDEKLWWAYGFVYGDGTITRKNGEAKGSMVRLCGEKARYLDRFTELGFAYSCPPSCDNDPIVYTGRYLKTLPQTGDDPALIKAFVRGYLDADGTKPAKFNSTFGRILATSEESKRFIREFFPVAGMFISCERVANQETNFGTRSNEAVWFNIFDSCGESANSSYNVRDISESADVETVWCLEVEEDRSFTLANGIVTGNCSFTKVENPADLVDVFWLLLQGCGVGFKPVPGLLEGFNPTVQEIEIIPSVRTEKGGQEHTSETFEDGVWTITVGDSAKAWAKSLGKLMAGKYPARKIVIDLSQLRPAGKRLKGYGWLSSGWKPLEKAYTRIAKLMIAAGGRILNAIEIGDIVNHLGTVLSSRRSAQIWLHDVGAPNEDEFVTAKIGRYENGNEHREQSNNSLVFWQKPERSRIVDLLHTILLGGEPGFINGAEAKRRAPDFEGSNPCVTGDTLILTKLGYRAIGNLVGKEVEVWNGIEWSKTTPFSTGVNPLLEVRLSDGTSLKCTPYHKFMVQNAYNVQPQRVEAKDLKIGDKMGKYTMPVVEGNVVYEVDAYSQGFYSGDGNADREFSFVYEPKIACAAHLNGEVGDLKEIAGEQQGRRARWAHGPMLDKTFVPMNGTVAYRLNWLAGLLDADGSVLTYDNGKSIQLSSVDRDFLNEVRLMLTTLGVQAKVVKSRDEHDMTVRGTTYNAQASWRLLINCQDTYHLTDELGMMCHRLDLQQPYPQRDARRFVTVTKVVDLGCAEETFCFTEPKNNTGTFNGIVTGQCAEILLPDKGFCNLVQVVWHRFNGNLKGLLRAQYIAGRANYRQTCVDMKDGVLQLAWDNNQHLLRLCGVAPLGYVSWEGMDDPMMLKQVRDAAINGAKSMADELGTPRPRRVTQVQPGGTSSKHLGLEGDEVHEGAHLALSRWVFNNIGVSVGEPLLDALRAANYRIKPHPFDPAAMLVTIPVEYPASPLFTKTTMVIDGQEEYVEINAESAVSQLNRYANLMRYYVDHNASITVSFDENEIEDMADWFMANWDDYVGVSFLKRNDPTKTAADLGFSYLPQETVSKRMCDEYAATLLPLDLSTDNSSELLDMDDCSTGACPVR